MARVEVGPLCVEDEAFGGHTVRYRTHFTCTVILDWYDTSSSVEDRTEEQLRNLPPAMHSLAESLLGRMVEVGRYQTSPQEAAEWRVVAAVTHAMSRNAAIQGILDSYREIDLIASSVETMRAAHDHSLHVSMTIELVRTSRQPAQRLQSIADEAEPDEAKRKDAGGYDRRLRLRGRKA